LRAAAARNSGDFIRQRELEVGGLGFGEFLTFDTTDMPVRGFEDGTLRGDSAGIGSIEYRFPIHEIDRGPTTIPIFFNRIHGSVFADGGRAGGDTIASAGAEVAADIIFGNALPLRYRLGVAVRLTDPSQGRVEPYLTIGASF
jgi:outer membrane protein assembly factor BamA